MTVVLPERAASFVPVPLEGLVGAEPLPFPLYLGTGQGLPVLYRDESTAFADVHVARLQTEGVRSIYIREQDSVLYHRRVERELDRLLRKNSVPLEHRASVLCGVAREVAQDLLASPLAQDGVVRAQRMLGAASALMLRDNKAFGVVRSILQARHDVADHSMVASLLCLGLARQVMGSDATGLVQAGLAGLLHDVGRVGFEGDVEDGEHVRRGIDALRQADVPPIVCEAVLGHHERMDGSGYPTGLHGAAIPVLARVVGLVDTFANLYAEQKARVGVFETLRILGEVYRGCFDEQIAVALVQMFR